MTRATIGRGLRHGGTGIRILDSGGTAESTVSANTLGPMANRIRAVGKRIKCMGMAPVSSRMATHSRVLGNMIHKLALALIDGLMGIRSCASSRTRTHTLPNRLSCQGSARKRARNLLTQCQISSAQARIARQSSPQEHMEIQPRRARRARRAMGTVRTMLLVSLVATG